MKQRKRKSFFGAVNLSASVLAALLPMVLLTGLFTGCPHKAKEEPKAEAVITYKVEHWQQNAQDDKYTLKETEEKPGKADENTAAVAKTYEGFTAKAVTQQKIKADSSTVVKIEYDRNMVTLKLNLNGGMTNPELEDGADGTKLLKGKFGAKVKLENLGKTGNVLEKWTPSLPETFPASSSDTTYTASWVDGYIVTIRGDERTKIADNTFKANLNPIQTWNDIKAQVKAKASLKSEWLGGDYEVYEWRLGDENGAKLTDGYWIDKHLTVYAVTNYNKFNIAGNTIKLTADGKGYTTEAAPRGRIIIPEGITEIADGSGLGNGGAFMNCTGITSVQFPQGLTKIGKGAFFDCTGLTSLDLSACRSLNQIGNVAFAECTGLTSINLPTSLTQIGDSAFSECTGLTSLNLPTSLTQIGKGAFFDCTGLTSLDLSACRSLNQIGDSAFADCTGLTSLTLPTSLTQIGDVAFAGCTGLTGINLPTSLTQIGEWAFSGCTGLTSINLSAGLTKIGMGAFAGCTGLTRLMVDSGNTAYKTENNILYTKDGMILVCAAGGLTSVTIPDTVTAIYELAFCNCTGLTHLTVDSGNTVYKAEHNIVYTKEGNTLVCAAGGLTSVTILDTVTAIGERAFGGCMRLTSLDLSGCKSLNQIGEGAFVVCSVLKEVFLPASLTQIGKRAFSGCTDLESVVFVDTENWKADSTSIDSNDLKNPATAAQYLREIINNGGYCDKEWKKN